MPQLQFNKAEMAALRLLARGGARYGTRIAIMYSLKDRGICYAHDKGSHIGAGRFTWRPTQYGWKVIREVL